MAQGFTPGHFIIFILFHKDVISDRYDMDRTALAHPAGSCRLRIVVEKTSIRWVYSQ